ncbi:hypothetical protein DUI87_27187 [Hirundo rustica rustica]|uniref:Uncharacterized protein n=1 Tax=Hirundo rustica rustica TaxID=333673 RepID=A0A3M0J679_HIRRU|nr:hypothetical protein DUI87_27187 [Hirundo rustica rustica]
MRDLLWGTTKVTPESPLGQEVGKFKGYCREAGSMKQVEMSGPHLKVRYAAPIKGERKRGQQMESVTPFTKYRKPFPWTGIKANIPLGSGPGSQTPLSRSLTLQGSQRNALDSNISPSCLNQKHVFGNPVYGLPSPNDANACKKCRQACCAVSPMCNDAKTAPENVSTET